MSDAERLWFEVLAADPVLPPNAERECWDVVCRGVERATRWLLFSQPADAAASGLAALFVAPVRELLGALPLLLPDGLREKAAVNVERLAGTGVPRALPQQIVPLLRLVELLDIVQLALERGRPHGIVAEAYYQLDDLLELDWLEQRLIEQPATNVWSQRAVEALREELIAVRRQLTEQVLLARPDANSVNEALGDYLVIHRARLQRIGGLMDELTAQLHVDLSALLVVVRELRRFAEERL